MEELNRQNVKKEEGVLRNKKKRGRVGIKNTGKAAGARRG